MASRIITHPGQAHRDDFMACCLLVARCKWLQIERRDPTEGELADPEVFVVDVGGRHEIELNNYDHHQFAAGTVSCAISLVIEKLGVSLQMARDAWKWFEFSELLDSQGPFRTAFHYNMEPEALLATVSPIETSMLRWFGEMNLIAVGSPLHSLMVRIGQEKLDYLDVIQQRMKLLESHLVLHERGDYLVADASAIDRADSPTTGLEEYINRIGGDIPVTITQDDRGTGLCLFRRNDDPRIDFSRLEGVEGVVFAHKGGFVAKLESGVDPFGMIALAEVEHETAQ